MGPPKADSSTGTENVCLFCLSICRGQACDDVIVNFIKLLGRFTGRELLPNFTIEDCDKLFRCCENCEVLISSISELYHKIKCLELYLEWKLNKLVNIMTVGGKVPSRVHNLKQMLMQTDLEIGSSEFVRKKLKNLKGIRRDLIRECNHRLAQAQPRVRLEKLSLGGNEGTCKSSSDSKKFQKTTRPPETIITMTSALSMFLGWTVSFSALVFLSTPHSDGIPKTTPESISDGANDEIVTNQLLCLAEAESIPAPTTAKSIQIKESRAHKDDRDG